MFYPIFQVMYKYTMLAVKCIYACYQMCICLLSNVYLLAVKHTKCCIDVAVASLKMLDNPKSFSNLVSSQSIIEYEHEARYSEPVGILCTKRVFKCAKQCWHHSSSGNGHSKQGAA